ncbi:MAG: sulfatase [Actinobacteria bacterium]|nr:sulfatase [Actinomycetota bacterium]
MTNILWITTHDISPHIGAYRDSYPGADAVRTPHLDQLAAEGIRFDQAFAAAPVCSPSRSAIMTGRYPISIGTMHHRTRAVVPPEVQLLPQLFREAGYYTTNNVFTDFQVNVPAPVYDECSPTAHWRNRPTRETPFFAAFHGMTTHESKLYLSEAEHLEATPDVTHRHDPEDIEVPPYHPDTIEFRTAWARYFDLIEQMDHEVGVLLQQLEDDGLAEDTIVVFWSDHGLGMPRGKRWLNDSGLREPLIVRWPGRIAPGSVNDDVVQLLDLAPTMLVACGLTVPASMDGEPLFDVEGAATDRASRYAYGSRDRMDEQDDTSRTVRDARFRYIRHLHPDRSGMQHCEYPDRLSTWRSVRDLAFAEADQVAKGDVRDRLTDAQRMLVQVPRPVEELYDLRADPHELVNLASDAAHAAETARLSTALDTWMTACGDLGQRPESELIAQWRPEGAMQTADTPRAWIADGRLHVECATDGAVLGWTATPPEAARPRHPLQEKMGIDDDGRGWRLWTAPAEVPSGRLWVGAWRLGYRPSAEAVVEVA